MTAVASTGKPYHHNEQCDLWYSYSGLPTCDSMVESVLVADTEFGKVSNMRTHEVKAVEYSTRVNETTLDSRLRDP